MTRRCIPLTCVTHRTRNNPPNAWSRFIRPARGSSAAFMNYDRQEVESQKWLHNKIQTSFTFCDQSKCSRSAHSASALLALHHETFPRYKNGSAPDRIAWQTGSWPSWHSSLQLCKKEQTYYPSEATKAGTYYGAGSGT